MEALERSVHDPRNLLDELPQREHAVIEFGCAERKRNRDAVGVDLRELPGVDIVGDAFAVLSRLPDESISEIRSSHFLEHIGPATRSSPSLKRGSKVAAAESGFRSTSALRARTSVCGSAA